MSIEFPESLAATVQTACVMSEPDDLGRVAAIAVLRALHDHLESPSGGSKMISGNDTARWADKLEANR